MKLKRDRANARLSAKERTALYADRYRSPMTAVDKQVEHDLSQSTRPVEALRRCINDGQVSPHVVRLCLEAQWSEQVSIPRGERWKVHESQRQDRLARLTILHILRDFEKWITFLHRERTAVDTLCYFAVIEGLEQYVLTWLGVQTCDNNNFWRAEVFASICKASELLDTHESADGSLTTFFKVVDMMAIKRAERSALKNRGEALLPSAIL